MLDVGWTELVVIAIVLIVVVGPKDLPPMLRTFGKMMSKMRGMAADFRHQFDEALREADLDEVRKTISDAQRLNPAHSLREAMNPLRQMGNEIKADLQKAARPDAKPDAVASTTDSASDVLASQPLSAPYVAEPVTPVMPAPLGAITPLAPAAPISSFVPVSSPVPTTVAISTPAPDPDVAVAKVRKKTVKAADMNGTVAAKPQKKTAKRVAEIDAAKPRKRKAPSKPVTGDDA